MWSLLWALGYWLVACPWLSPQAPSPSPLGHRVHFPGSGQAPPQRAYWDQPHPHWLCFRKTMLNDLLRFDVKDCSWCRWVASELQGAGL